MLQGIMQVIQHSWVCFFMVTIWHVVVGVYTNHCDARCNEDLVASWTIIGCNLAGEEYEPFPHIH